MQRPLRGLHTMTLGPWNGGIGKIETDLVDKK